MAVWLPPEYSDWLSAIKAKMKELKEDIDLTYGSYGYIQLYTWAHIAEALSECSENHREDLHILTAAGEFIDRWAEGLGLKDNVSGTGRIQASTSSGKSALTVTYNGTTAYELDDTYTLTDTAGRSYQLDSTYEFTGAGTYNFDVVSLDTGYATNLQIGDTLTFDSPPTNISETATIAVALTGGADEETDDALSTRNFNHFAEPPLSGNYKDYIETIENYAPGSLKAYVWGKRCNSPYGFGTVDYCALYKGQTKSARILSSSYMSDLDDYLEEYLPFYTLKTTRNLTITEIQPVIEVTFSLADNVDSSKQCDFDAQANKRYVSSVDSSTRTLTLNSSSNSHIEENDIIIVAGYEAIVESVSGTDIVVNSWVWPSSIDLSDRGDGTGYYILSGGGIIKDLYDGVQDYLDLLGPAAGDYAAPIRDWDDTIRLSHLESAFVVAGEGYVRNISETLIGGSESDYAPSYDNTNAVQLLTYAEIQIYEEK